MAPGRSVGGWLGHSAWFRRAAGSVQEKAVAARPLLSRPSCRLACSSAAFQGYLGGCLPAGCRSLRQLGLRGKRRRHGRRPTMRVPATPAATAVSRRLPAATSPPWATSVNGCWWTHNTPHDLLGHSLFWCLRNQPLLRWFCSWIHQNWSVNEGNVERQGSCNYASISFPVSAALLRSCLRSSALIRIAVSKNSSSVLWSSLHC